MPMIYILLFGVFGFISWRLFSLPTQDTPRLLRGNTRTVFFTLSLFLAVAFYFLFTISISQGFENNHNAP